MIVGGNIDHATRVLTTAIALETGKGNLALALGLGFVLIALELLDVGGTYATALLVYAAAPCPVSAHALARQLGGDAKTTAAMVATQTAASVATLPLWLWLAAELL